MSDESYIAVRGWVREVRRQSILFAAGEAECTGGRTAQWIPRSLIHGTDETTLDGCILHAPVTLRIFAWKVNELGWRSARAADGATRDLFGV
jgi:hypothetical protein